MQLLGNTLPCVMLTLLLGNLCPLTAQSGDEFSPDVPLVFRAIKTHRSGSMVFAPRATGVYAAYDSRSTVEAALEALPETRRVVFAGGMTPVESALEPMERYKSPSIWEQYPSYIVAAGLLCGMEAILIMALLVQRQRRQRPEAALRRRESLCNAVLASLPGQVAVIDQTGTIIEVNETWRSFVRHHHGGPWDKVGVGTNYVEVCRRAAQTPDSTAQAALDGIASVLEGSSAAFSLEYRCVLPGEALWYMMSVESLRRPEGGAVISHHNITDRKHAEEEQVHLAQQVDRERQRLNEIVANVPGIVWEVWGVPGDPSRRTNFVSEYVEKMLGYRVDVWLSTPNFWLSIVHPDDAERAKREAEAIFASRQGNFQQYRLVAQDGRVVWVEAHLAVICNEAGAPIGLRGVTMDITARKQVEEELRASEERYRTIVEEQTDLICRFLPDTTLTFVNEAYAYCRYFGKTREELIGQSFLSLIPKEAQQAAAEHVQSLCEHPRIESYEHPALGAGGNMRWQQWVDRQILDDSGRIVEFQSVGRDITERRQAEAAIQQAQAELSHANRVLTIGELAASLAHEISQPLTAILSNAQAAQRFLDAASPNIAEVRDILVDIVDDDRRAGEVIRRLRGFLRRSKVELQPLNLNQVIREVVRLLSNEAVLRNVAIVLTLDPTLPPVRGDRVQLQQVVLNLMLNGFDAMAELTEGDRRLVVRTQRVGAASIQAAVQDCGGGLEKDKLERIFDPFFTTKADGMGMGLSICQSIIETHGGHLWAMTNPDRGLTFHFTLPVRNQEEQP